MLIFFSGSIGDTLICLPIFSALRQQLPGEKLYLLHDDAQPGCRQLLEPTGLIDAFLTYHSGTKLMDRLRILQQFRHLLHPLRERRMLYLIRSQMNFMQRFNRDRLVFRLLGIRKFLGVQPPIELPLKKKGTMLALQPSHLELFRQRLSQDHIFFSADQISAEILNFTSTEMQHIAEWRKKLRHLAGPRHCIAVAIGGNKNSCRWSIERYVEVMHQLLLEQNYLFVFWGGPKDQPDIQKAMAALPAGSTLSATEVGALSLRESIGAMAECCWYLGNDTGTMHMAVTAGVKCVVSFSSYDYPGLWYPIGSGHHVLRAYAECEPCYCNDCPKGKEPLCLQSITVEQVVAECRALASERNKESR